MKISFHTVQDNLDTTRGYGHAGFKVVTSLQELGHTVKFDDPDSPVQMSFCQPAWQEFHPGQYRISYVPWESTELPSGWVERLNDREEVWATSDWVAEVYRNCGVKKPIYTYKHGLDPSWAPIKRENDGVVKFLHVGEPALRKGGQLAMDAFIAAFGNRDDVHLTMKCYYQHYLRSWVDGEHGNSEDVYDNITINKDLMFDGEMHELFATHDVLVYPSYGEGFGFIPLQALGTGMPVISTYDWAEYKNFIHMGIPGRMDRSVWTVHPGNVLYPNFDSIVDFYKTAADNIDALHSIHYAQAPQVHQDYNWLTITENAWKHLENKF